MEDLWLEDSTRGVSARVQDDLGVNEVPGGYSFVQSLAKSGSGCHECGPLVWRSLFGIRRIYRRCTTQQVYTFLVGVLEFS